MKEIEKKENKSQKVTALSQIEKIKYLGLGAAIFMVVTVLGLFVIGSLKVASRSITGVNGNGFGGGRISERGFEQMGRGKGMGQGIGRGERNGNMVSGKVTKVEDKKITIDDDGESSTFVITEDTSFSVDSNTEIKVGDSLVVMLEKDISGNIEAHKIVVNPTRF